MLKLIKTKTFKTILFSIALIFMLLCFTGCANITYYVIPNAGDHFEQGVKIALSKQEAQKYGYDLVNLKNQVYALASNEANDWRTKFNAQLQTCYENGKITLDEYMFITEAKPFKVTTDQKLTDDGYDVYFAISIYPASNNQYTFSIANIANIFQYADIINPGGSEDDNDFVEDIGVAYLRGYTQESPYDNETIDSIANLFLHDLGYASFNLTKKDVSYCYKYVTPSKRQHTNADTVEYRGNQYVHTWYIQQDDSGNVQDVTMKFFYTYLNTTVWYWIGLGVTLVGAVIIVLVLYFTNKRNKNNTDSIIISN